MSNSTSNNPTTASKEVSVTQAINASPARVWAMISDVTRMGEWSPETKSCSWLKGATGPAVGAGFKGNNEIGKKRWSTNSVVAQCEPGKSFAFDVGAMGLKVARWAYTIESGIDANSCSVTETYTDRRGALVRMLGKPLTGVDDRSQHNRAGIETTLANLAKAAEQS